MISVKCIRGAGDREAPKITDELITTEHLAVLRGTAYLDDAYYNRTVRTVQAPYAPVVDGDVAAIHAPLIASGNYLVRRVTISIEPPGRITMALELEGEHEDPA